MFIKEHIGRIIQTIIAIPFLVFTLLYWNDNRLGQNIINLTTVLFYIIGADHVLLFYRWFTKQQNLQFEFAFILAALFVNGKLLEMYHPSQKDLLFNSICYYNLIVVLVLNALFLVMIIVTIVFYTIRQIYRLQTQTLLSPSQKLQPQELAQLMQSSKNYTQVPNQIKQANRTCSICLMDFQNDTMCIVLPGCNHIFHTQCIDQWLRSNSTCPYCRNNIRLSLI